MLSRTAIRQALHFSFGLTFAEIARLYQVTPRGIQSSILGNDTRAWAMRPEVERLEAIATAKAMLEVEALLEAAR